MKAEPWSCVWMLLQSHIRQNVMCTCFNSIIQPSVWLQIRWRWYRNSLPAVCSLGSGWMLLLKTPFCSLQCGELENKGINLRYSEGVGTEKLSCIRAHLIFRLYEHFITFSFPLEVIIFVLPWAFVLTYTNSVGETAFNKTLPPPPPPPPPRQRWRWRRRKMWLSPCSVCIWSCL